MSAAAGWTRPLFSSAVVKPGKVKGKLLQAMLDPLPALASSPGSLPGCRSVAASRKPTCEVLAASAMALSTVALCACKDNTSRPRSMSMAAKHAACSIMPARRAQAVLLSHHCMPCLRIRHAHTGQCQAYQKLCCAATSF